MHPKVTRNTKVSESDKPRCFIETEVALPESVRLVTPTPCCEELSAAIFQDKRYRCAIFATERHDSSLDASKAAKTRSRESGLTSPAADFTLIFMNSIKTTSAATG